MSTLPTTTYGPGGYDPGRPNDNVMATGTIEVPQETLNAAQIHENVLSAQAQIQAWIGNNPAGAVLTASQTLTLAKLLNGLCKILLESFDSVDGT